MSVWYDKNAPVHQDGHRSSRLSEAFHMHHVRHDPPVTALAAESLFVTWYFCSGTFHECAKGSGPRTMRFIWFRQNADELSPARDFNGADPVKYILHPSSSSSHTHLPLLLPSLHSRPTPLPRLHTFQQRQLPAAQSKGKTGIGHSERVPRRLKQRLITRTTRCSFPFTLYLLTLPLDITHRTINTNYT